MWIIIRFVTCWGDCIMNIKVPISVGEFFDKITILEIKNDRIQDSGKLVNIRKELDSLNAMLADMSISRDDIQDEISELRGVNEKLWVIEDDIRDQEASKTFGERFIELARAVYFTNDRRSEIKRAINIKLGSDFIEEKSYENYQ